MSEIFVMADPHGAFRAVEQCLERSGFNKEEDELILLGDVCDGWKQIKECVDLFLSINTTNIMGNHDQWALEWMTSGEAPDIWTSQGGWNTIMSYMPDLDRYTLTRRYYVEPKGIPQEHIDFFKNAYLFLEDEIDGKQMLFVHGGYDMRNPAEMNSQDTLLWDRDLFLKSINNEVMARKGGYDPKPFPFYDEIFIGHTTTENITTNRACQKVGLRGDVPVHACNVWAMDQGGGWSGYLSIMNVRTKEYWVSDKVSTLYPEEKGRG